MVVINNKTTKEDLDVENLEDKNRKINATNAILSTLDLPPDKKPGEKPEEKPVVNEGEKTDDQILAADEKDLTEDEITRKTELLENPEELETDKTDEEILAAKDEDLNEQELRYKKQLTEDKEDLIPKSKYEKTIKRMEKRIADLTAKAHEKEPAVTDPDIVRLEKMPIEKLEGYKQAVKKELRENNRKLAKGEDVEENRIDALEDLSDKIDDALKTFPARFHRKQVALYNDVADEIENDPEIKDLEKAAPEIKQIAEKIYADYPKLRLSEEGQAMALRLASDHWKLKNSFSVGKSGTDDLKKRHRRLLRKTTLDSNIIKGSHKAGGLKQLKSDATTKGAGIEVKHHYIKNAPEFNIDALIPDEFKK